MDYSKIKAEVNNDQFKFDSIDLTEFDVVDCKNGHFHILKDQQSYLAEIIEEDYNSKEFTIKINGHLFQIKLLDEHDQMVKSLGLSKKQINKVNEIKAPMPGLILEVLIKEGDTIENDTPLLILEAMKMENVLKSQGDGVVKSILIKKGDAVEKGQVLIDLT